MAVGARAAVAGYVLDDGQDAAVERFFRGYFTEERSLFDRPSLEALAADAGLDAAEVSRVLDGRITAAQYAIVMRKGQNAAAGAYLRQFVEEIKNDGLIKSAIAKAGLRGVGVAAGR